LQRKTIDGADAEVVSPAAPAYRTRFHGFSRTINLCGS
jgi:hypothetical protein